MKDSVSILNAFRNKYYTDGNNTENGIVANAIDDVLPEYVKLKEMSHGKWIKKVNESFTFHSIVICSVCGEEAFYDEVHGYYDDENYCHKCGARMDGDTK